MSLFNFKSIFSYFTTPSFLLPRLHYSLDSLYLKPIQNIYSSTFIQWFRACVEPNLIQLHSSESQFTERQLPTVWHGHHHKYRWNNSRLLVNIPINGILYGVSMLFWEAKGPRKERMATSGFMCSSTQNGYCCNRAAEIELLNNKNYLFSVGACTHKVLMLCWACRAHASLTLFGLVAVDISTDPAVAI